MCVCTGTRVQCARHRKLVPSARGRDRTRVAAAPCDGMSVCGAQSCGAARFSLRTPVRHEAEGPVAWSTPGWRQISHFVLSLVFKLPRPSQAAPS